MNDRQIGRLMETAQKVFIEGLIIKAEEMMELLNNCNGQLTDSNVNDLLRFFHSISGTASTLGLSYFSSIGKAWESNLSEMVGQGRRADAAALHELYDTLDGIREKASSMGAKKSQDDEPEGGEYVNMPDRGKILLIDDDISILKLLENVFTIEGYKVYICDDSESAMDTVAIARPDIVILDIMMPKLSGYEVLERIRSNPDYSDMSIIFLSAKGSADDRILGLKSGADDYVSKPFAIGEILARTEMLMKRSDKYRDKLLKDYLTDAYSRYYFNIRMLEELERYRKGGRAFSIAFIDMDRFKIINDKYGHQTGDYVLKKLVSFITGEIRANGSVFRYGGEELIILLPDTPEDNACLLIDGLRRKFCREPISVGGVEVHVTFSAGIRQIKSKDESMEQLIGDADRAMYLAKKTGRNRVVVYNKEVETNDLKKTLLIVDDENTILRLLRDKFTSIGYNVITAEDGYGAIDLAVRTNPDVILLDLVLPDIDGFEVCRRIRENAHTCSSRIIMLSKKKEKKNIVKGLHSGADDYVTKPFSIAELEARVMRALNNAV